jgi:SAM-dependent methyltransferase
MGLSLGTLEMIFREHMHKPLPKCLHTIGRQVIQCEYEQILALFRHTGITPKKVDVVHDHSTLEGLAYLKETGRPWVSDTTVFAMLGVEKLAVIDVSDYEQADIIADLTQPLPERHEASADFIIGGSTLDNVFNPAMYLMNMARLLKPGGRLFEINASVNMFFPYIIFTPFWFLDYFVVNKFADCRVYMLEIMKQWYVYGMDWQGETHVDGIPMNNFPNRPGCQLWTVVIAEKGQNSTYAQQPIQFWYRPEEQWLTYRETLAAMRGNARKWGKYTPLSAANRDELPPADQPGYRFLGRTFLGERSPAIAAAADALVQHKAGNLARAEIIYRHALKHDATALEPRYMLAMLLLQKSAGNHRVEAEALLRTIVDSDTANAGMRQNAARMLSSLPSLQIPR